MIRPIPKSVGKIKADRCQISRLSERLDGYDEHALVLRFDVSKKDVTRIVTIRGFKRWENVSYFYGTVRYKTGEGYHGGIRLYEPKHPEPGWFDLGKWTEFKTYYLGEERADLNSVDVSLLLYSEQYGSAYLLKYDIRGL